MPEYMELSAESKAEQAKHAEAMKKFEAQKKARSIVVPTAIEDVKARLRELGHPVTLFGEGHADRRERLRETIAYMELDEHDMKAIQAHMNKSSAAASSSSSAQEQLTKQKEVFYSAATEGIIEARKHLSDVTFEISHERLKRLRAIRDSESLQAAEDKIALELYNHNKDLVLNMSQFADERPLTCVRYSSDGEAIASSSLGNTVKVWDSNLSCLGLLRTHVDRVTSVSWHPQSSLTQTDSPVLLASSSADGSCILWDCRKLDKSSQQQQQQLQQQHQGEEGNSMEVEADASAASVTTTATGVAGSKQTALVHKLTGHQGVVSSCAFHPHGRLLGTSGHDFSWRMWDLETGAEFLLQDGHVKECSALGFHPDGSLILTGDAGGVALLWDLRSGQCILPLQGHSKKISGVSFNANGFQVATCSLDNMVKVWDLRQRKCGYTLPAHANILSGVKYSTSGELLLTSSFDGTLKVWSARDHRILRTLSGHSGKVMACDFGPDERRVISAGYDRTIKLWAHKDEF